MKLPVPHDIIGYNEEEAATKVSFGLAIGRRLTTHTHPSLEILYLIDGTNINFHIDDRKFELKKGDIVVINGMEAHWISEATEDLVSFVVTAQPAFLSPFRELFKKSRVRCPVISPRVDPKVYAFFHPMFEELYDNYKTRNENTYYREYMNGLAYMIFASIPRMLGLEPRMENIFSDKLKFPLYHVYGYIEDNIGKPITLVSAAAYINISPSRLSHMFKEFMGMSFAKYLAKYRIQYAKELLISRPNETITNICFLSGFNNMQHFNRTFKSEYGMSPSQYKKRHSVQL